jgi:hypothetical protein
MYRSSASTSMGPPTRSVLLACRDEVRVPEAGLAERVGEGRDAGGALKNLDGIAGLDHGERAVAVGVVGLPLGDLRGPQLHEPAHAGIRDPRRVRGITKDEHGGPPGRDFRSGACAIQTRL